MSEKTRKTIVRTVAIVLAALMVVGGFATILMYLL